MVVWVDTSSSAKLLLVYWRWIVVSIIVLPSPSESTLRLPVGLGWWWYSIMINYAWYWSQTWTCCSDLFVNMGGKKMWARKPQVWLILAPSLTVKYRQNDIGIMMHWQHYSLEARLPHYGESTIFLLHKDTKSPQTALTLFEGLSLSRFPYKKGDKFVAFTYAVLDKAMDYSRPRLIKFAEDLLDHYVEGHWSNGFSDRKSAHAMI